MNTRPPLDDRVLELLAGRALHDLDSSETAELESMIARLDPAQARDLRAEQTQLNSLTGATLAGWSRGEKTPPLPAALRARILAQAAANPPGAPATVSAPTTPASMRLREKFAWLTAAASIALAVFAWNRPGSVRPAEPAWQARAQLIREADSKVITWSATEDPSAQGVSGDIVWNAEQQRGFMRFKGLAQNDPRLQQYQLWIFDKGREGDFPVDGGVFDIGAASKDPSTGDLVVPIAPKLAVRDPAMFAVTIEMPGGVVVTKRERLLLLAKAEEAK